MDKQDKPEVDMTILQKKKKVIRLSDQETLLLLRAYQEHPSSWSEIIGTIKSNLQSLPEDARHLYNTSETKQIKERLCSKLQRIMVTPLNAIKNEAIRTQVAVVQSLEKNLLQNQDAPSASHTPAPSTSHRPAEQANVRDEMAAAFSNDEGQADDAQQNDTIPEKDDKEDKIPVGKKRKLSTMELIRKNQLNYDKFITKKNPKATENTRSQQQQQL